MSIVFHTDNYEPSWYETQFANNTPSPYIVYKQEFYYFLYGARNTPAKRKYPTRLENGELKESQPEYFYATTQAVDYAAIIEILSPTSVRVEYIPNWPATTPYYLYLAQLDADGSNDPDQVFTPIYRYVRINDEIPKLKVTDITDDIVTFSADITLTDQGDNPYFLVFFNYPIDDLIKQELTVYDTLGITLGTNKRISEVIDSNTFKLEVAVLQDLAGNDLDIDIAVPTVGKALILLKGDAGTLLRYDEIEVKDVLQLESITEDYYADTNLFQEDIPPVDDPFEDLTPPETEGSGEDPADPEPTGRLVTTTYLISISPYVQGLSVDHYFSYYELVTNLSANITDEELSVPLPGAQSSLRPHTFHNYAKAPASIGVYGNTWACPLPYPETTTVEDQDEPEINGFLTPKILTDRRLNYRRDRNSWEIGGTVFLIARSFSVANIVADCFVRRNRTWYFKMESNLYHVHLEKW